MKLRMLLSVLLLSSTLFAQARSSAPRTMRVDYYHSGNATSEIFGQKAVVIEPLPWPGNPRKPLDDSNLGKYFFEVKEKATGKALYSRGFASIYGEWETTSEAKKVNRTFEESFRFPTPEAPVEITLSKRADDNSWKKIWTTEVDPKDMFVDPSVPPAPAQPIALEKNGDPADKVDFLILADGYAKADQAKCRKDADRLKEILFATSPFQERRKDFNVWLLCPVSTESGISRPSLGIHHRSPVRATYDAFGSERYVLTFDNHAFRETAMFAPYDFVEILANGKTYGGGGIYGLYSTVSSDNLYSPYVFVHEFGHHFGGLADEYYTSAVSYESPANKVEPWEPNVTALLDDKNLKWKSLVTPGTPIPTAWPKEEFEKYEMEVQATRKKLRAEKRPESEMEALFTKEQKHVDALLGSHANAKKVGAFEGAVYEAKDYYRPQINCIMFTRTNYFCDVCKAAIERVVDLYTK